MVRLLLALLLIIANAPFAWAQDVVTRVDSTRVVIDESFRLVFEATKEPAQPPDFSVLETDFEIVSKSSSTSLQAINGDFSRQHVWALTLIPKRTGALTIPQVQFGTDTSRTLEITVTDRPVGEEPELFFEIVAEPRELYVQQNLLYTIRLYRSVVVGNSRIGEPELKQGDAIVERLDDGRSFEQMRNGKRHVVVERSYAIFPQQSGPLTINPIVFEGQVIERGALPRVKRLRSDVVSLDVKPIPSAFSGSVWLPSSELSLEEEWSGDMLTAGEPVTWTLTLRAKGLTSTQLPDFELAWDEKLNAYPDQPQLRDRVAVDGIVGERQQKIALIATEAGEYVLPDVTMVWWNTESDEQETATLPGRTIQVKGAAGVSQAVKPTVPLPQVVEEEVSPVDIEVPGAMIPSWQYWLMGLFLLGWVGTALAWIFSRRQKVDVVDVEDEDFRNTVNENTKALKLACQENKALDAKIALLKLARSYWTGVNSLVGLAACYSSTLSTELEALSEAVYCGNDDKHWQGDDLWRAWKEEVHGVVETRERTGPVLHPLVGA